MISHWRQLSGQNLSSSQYLDRRIHSTIIEKFGGQTDKSWIQEQKRAKQLEKYLYQIKNYLNDDSKENIFAANEKELLRDNLRKILGPQLENFLKTSGGTTFEKELVNLNLALMKIFTSETIDIEAKTYQISTGQQLNKAVENISKDVANALGIKTKKWIDKKDKSKGKNPYIQSTQIKIDLVTQGVEITQHMQGTSRLQKFFQLYANASFSAKNYDLQKLKNKSRGVSLGSTSLGRIFFDFLPFIDSLFSNSDILSSFSAALMNRKRNINLSEPNEEDEKIDTHLDHIRVIYQLQGLGQTIKDKNIQQLQSYIDRGVDFLIINDYRSDKIQVESTRALLVEFLKENLEEKKSDFFKMRNVTNKRDIVQRHIEYKI